MTVQEKTVRQMLADRIASLERQLAVIEARLQELRELQLLIGVPVSSEEIPSAPLPAGAPRPKAIPAPTESPVQELWVLRSLADDGPAGSVELARRIGASERVVGSLLRNRIDWGWWRRVDPKNRTSPWQITPAGREQLAALASGTLPSPT